MNSIGNYFIDFESCYMNIDKQFLILDHIIFDNQDIDFFESMVRQNQNTLTLKSVYKYNRKA